MESEEDELVWVMAAVKFGLLSGVGDRVYQNRVHRYRAYVKIAGRHIEPFLQVDPEEK